MRFPSFRIAALTVLLAASPSLGQAEDPDATRAREEIGAELEELGTTLKAAYMSGALSGEEAKAIYDRVARAAKAAYVRDFGAGGDKKEQAPSAKGNVARLFVPKPQQIRVLLQPEFLQRDLPLLRDELGLEPEQMVIAEAILDDYGKAYELARTPLVEALSQYRGASLDAYIAHALRDVDIRIGDALDEGAGIDREEARNRMAEALDRIDREKAEDIAAASDEDRAKYDAWKDRMMTASSELDDRLAAIRDRTTARLTAMGRDDATLSADDLVDLARQLRADRAQLRSDVSTLLDSITNDAQRGDDRRRFEAALARIRILQQLPRGRLGGESMNLWLALNETGRRATDGLDEAIAPARTLLRERAIEIVETMDLRTEATLDRELAGLEFQSARDRIAAVDETSIFELDGARLAAAMRPYAGASRREIEASVAVRDALLALLDESAQAIERAHPASALASAYRQAALRRGFPVETRGRWAERAVAGAIALDGLDEEVREALHVLQAELAAELQVIRATAIAGRIERDPKLARDFIESELGQEKADYGDDVWQELGQDAFAAADDRTATALRELLTEEQIGQIRKRWASKRSGK